MRIIYDFRQYCKGQLVPLNWKQRIKHASRELLDNIEDGMRLRAWVDTIQVYQTSGYTVIAFEMPDSKGNQLALWKSPSPTQK